jgi:hypothetical protein
MAYNRYKSLIKILIVAVIVVLAVSYYGSTRIAQTDAGHFMEARGAFVDSNRPRSIVEYPEDDGDTGAPSFQRLPVY